MNKRFLCSVIAILSVSPCLAEEPAASDCEARAVRTYRDAHLAPRVKDHYAYMGLGEDCRLETAFSEPAVSRLSAVAGYGETRFYDVSSKSGVAAAFNPHGVLLMADKGLLIPALNYSDTRLRDKFAPYPVGRVTEDCGVEIADENHARFLTRRYFSEEVSLARRTSRQELYKWILAKEGKLREDIGGSANPAYPGVSYFYYDGEEGALAKDRKAKAWVRLRGIPKAKILRLIGSGQVSVNVYSMYDKENEAPYRRHFETTGIPKMEVILLGEKARRELAAYLVSKETVPADFKITSYQEPFDFTRWNKESLFKLSLEVRAACDKRGAPMKRFPRFTLPLGEVCTTFGPALRAYVDSLRKRCVKEPEAFRSRNRYDHRGALFFGQILLRYPEARPSLCNKIAHSIYAWSHHPCLKSAP